MKDDIKEKGLSADDVYDRANWRRTCHPTSTPHKSENKRKEQNCTRQLPRFVVRFLWPNNQVCCIVQQSNKDDIIIFY